MINIDDLLPLLQGVIGNQANAQQQNKKKPQRWKFCVVLAANGWEAVKSDPIGKSDMMITWKKEGKKDVEIRLNFAEQCLWLDYMQQKENKK